MTDIKVGQTWRDKDKRRNTTIEIVEVPSDLRGDAEVVGHVVGTDETRTYQIDRLIKRWALVKDAEEELIFPVVKVEQVGVKHKTREQWLIAAVAAISKKVFVGFDVPPVRVSVGWPGGRGPKKNTIGQCFATASANDRIAQIFISPVVEDPMTVLSTLVHELVHALDDCKSGHKKDFIRIAKTVGLTGKWTATVAGDELKETLEEIAKKLGPYPHAAIRPQDRPIVQKTYMLKVVSPEEPDFFVRMTAGKLEEFGFPRDPWGNIMELEEK